LDIETAKTYIKQASQKNAQALSEYDAHRVLEAYGVPIAPVDLAVDAAAARDSAARLGYPVAVKACASNLPHKSERNLVHTQLMDEDDVSLACAAISAELDGENFDGFLVQAMAPGKREIIAGAVRDPQFGVCVMLGAGGIAVEAMEDVAFRRMPLTPLDVEEMIAELRAHRLFDAFRGEGPVDRKNLHALLNGVGRVLLENPTASQVEVNPARIVSGESVAVDALITLDGDAGAFTEAETRNTFKEGAFRALFEAESLAIIGVSASPLKWGFRILYNTLEGAYGGRLYGVNPKGQEVLGVPCFPSVEALPEAVDLALVVTPPAYVQATLEACAARGVRACLVITAGFGEIGGDEGQAAQQAMTQLARETGMLIAGPNCAGLASPAPTQLYAGMIACHPEAGGLSIVSQSGNVGGTALIWAQQHQVGVARFISTGNEAATTSEDYLAFLADDARTTSILSYVEGTRDGDHFFSLLQSTCRKKAVVLLKGGQTDAGSQAALSHTGALAGEHRVFHAVCRQAGAVVTNDLHAAVEAASVFAHMPLPKGRRVGIISQGGGWGVLAADACVRVGLNVVPLSEATLKTLDGFLPDWWNRVNPIDLVAGNDLLLLPKTIEVVAQDREIDALLVLGVGYITAMSEMTRQSERGKSLGLDVMADHAQQIEIEGLLRIPEIIRATGKPIIIASDTALSAGARNKAVRALEKEGCQVFASPANAAQTLAYLAERHEFLNGMPR
jgi:acyl-CoA synthetase (NDP forming)